MFLKRAPCGGSTCGWNYRVRPPKLSLLIARLYHAFRNYAATAADTFSSELGILSKSHPRLIISPTLRVVPPGTNGGVTGTGILAGSFGAFTIGLTSAILLPFCSSLLDTVQDRVLWVVAMTVWGTLGSILDSVLGGLLQASVVDRRSGKIVEGTGGQKVEVVPSHLLTEPC